ncbi:MAG: GTP pyrophosphokinase family protein [Sphaerochaetaceae bacterium]|nr:GTP pyrophosphokinase family protein [Sphaerochaetaceae bacterium]
MPENNAIQPRTMLENNLEMFDQMLEFKKLLLRYSSAMKMICTRLQILDEDYAIMYERNPIHSIKSRLKTTASIIEKLHRKKLPISIESISENLHDVAGIRIICSYLDDVYEISRAIQKQKDIKLKSIKDYISFPKENGYRSLHLIVSIPVNLLSDVYDVDVEIQIRTIAMDFWASLEHTLKYKKQIKNMDEIMERLQYCAESISELDIAMMTIRNSIELDDSPSDVKSQLIEKLKKLEKEFN